MTAGQFVYGLFWAFVIDVLLRTIWLLPACVLVQFALTSIRQRGMSTAIRGAGLESIGVIISLLPFLPLILREPTGADWLRRVPGAVAALLFIATWFVLYNVLEARHPEAATAHATAAAGTANKTARWVALAVAAVWTFGLGFIGGGFMDFGGDGEWRHESSVRSPQGDWRADIVIYLEPGGALSGSASEVYVLPASKPWSPHHRGLLIWRGRSTEIDGVVWDSNRALRVRATIGWNQTRTGVQAHSHGFTRGEFTAQTEVVPGR
jgi:hypothetical protein